MDREAVEFVGIVPKPDYAGSYITAIYTGNIAPGGNSIDNGTAAWRAGIATGSLPSKMTWNPADQVISAPSRAPHNLPASMRLCSDEKCIAMKLNGGNYDIYEENDSFNKTAVCIVSSFSSDSVFLEFSVPNGFRALITGRVQGETVADAKLTWLNAFNGATGPLQIGWGGQLMAVAPIPRPQQAVSLGVPQQQINPWLLLFGAVVGGALMDGGGGHHSTDHLDCASDPNWQQHGCISAARAGQQNHKQ